MRLRRLGAAGLVLAGLVAACSNGAQVEATASPEVVSSSSASPSPSPSASASPSASPSVSPSPSASPTPPADALRVLAVGDSVTTGFNSCELAQRCLEGTWFSADGGVLDLLAADGVPAVGVVAAHEGARVRDAGALIDRVLTEQPGEVDAVVLLLGANDQCAPSLAALEPLPDVAASLTALLAQLAALAPGAPLVLASPIDVPQVRDVAGDDPTATLIWGFGICETVLGVEADVEAARVRHAELVTVFEQVCAAQPQCRWDSGAVASAVTTVDELSPFDYFHPSRSGQVQIAETLWPTVASAFELP